jgi:transcription initiation factor TFIIB
LIVNFSVIDLAGPFVEILILYLIMMMDEVTKKQIAAGKNPMGFAATILYLSCLKTGENKTQTDIAAAAGVTDVTIRNRYKELKSKLELSNK